MRLSERYEVTRPLEEMELSLLRSALERPSLLSAHEEAVFRTALSLARLYRVRHQTHEVGVGAFLEPFRHELTRRLAPVLLGRERPSRAQLLPHLYGLEARVLHTVGQLKERLAHRLPPQAIEDELRHKALVLVLGGGGGTAYPYLGVMGLLHEYGLVPKLLVGTSMGAILGLFRSRMEHFAQDEMVAIIRSLSFRRLFRAVSTENRYGLPAALRLFLRAGLGRWFGVDHQGGAGPRLSQLPIKTIVAVSGVRRGKLPHPVEFYERLTSASPASLLNPLVLPRWFNALAELFARPDVLVRLHLGADAETEEFDALDAAGFSSALPGVIHYDVLRDDPHMHALLGRVFERHRLSRLVDGGLVDNLPARAAWKAVHKGLIGTRNALIVALNGFAMKLSQPLWLPLSRLAELNVARNRPWAHLVHDFARTLSPVTVVPSVEQLLRALAIGRRALMSELPLIRRALTPLPRLDA